MKTIRSLKSICGNVTVVAEEKQGYGSDLLQRHMTDISDPDVRRQIEKMSFLEIVS